MNGKNLLFFILTHVASSGFWASAHKPELVENGFIIIPSVAVLGCVVFMILYILETWDH